jgi:2-hydroxy-3-keto-5-methylthiopentenyl-1-phosphate phosphatase
MLPFPVFIMMHVVHKRRSVKTFTDSRIRDTHDARQRNLSAPPRLVRDVFEEPTSAVMIGDCTPDIRAANGLDHLVAAHIAEVPTKV